MKKYLCSILFFLFCVNCSLRAQSPAPTGPDLDAATGKLFGANQSFSATMEMQTVDPKSGDPITMPGKIYFDSGKSRFEVDMTQMKSSRMSPKDADQMKQMGMANIVIIGRPDKKISYLVYPGMESYVENPIKSADLSPDDYKIQTTALGNETVDGHPCVKNKDVVTDKKGHQIESTVWNATDLKNFPIKIQTTTAGDAATISYKEISFAKPDAKQFEPPSGYTKYDSASAMMRAQIMKQMGKKFSPFGH